MERRCYECDQEEEIAALREQLAAAQKDAARMKEILRDAHMPECYRIQISKGDYHYRKLIPPDEAVFIGEIAKEIVAAIDAAIEKEQGK